MVEQVRSCCDQCEKPFGPKKHGGGSPQRFCSRHCRMAWHAAQRKPACTLVPKISVSLSGQSPGNASVNVPRDFDWTVQKSRTLLEQLETTICRNGHGLLIRQSCNQQDDRWILVSNASIGTFVETVNALTKAFDEILSVYDTPEWRNSFNEDLKYHMRYVCESTTPEYDKMYFPKMRELLGDARKRCPTLEKK